MAVSHMTPASLARTLVDGCSFCDVARGSGDLRVFEDDWTVAFLDERPVLPGHVLVIPKGHFPYFDQLPPELVGPIFDTALRMLPAVEKGMGAEGSVMTLNVRVNQSVPHVHVHVLPRRRGDLLDDVLGPHHVYDSREEAEAVRDTIIQGLS